MGIWICLLIVFVLFVLSMIGVRLYGKGWDSGFESGKRSQKETWQIRLVNVNLAYWKCNKHGEATFHLINEPKEED